MKPEKILTATSKHLEIAEHYIKCKSRATEFTFSRNVYMYLCIELDCYITAKRPYTMGLINRDRTTIYNGWKKIKELMSIDEGVNKSITKLKNSLIPKHEQRSYIPCKPIFLTV